MAQNFDYILPPNPPKQPDETYHVWTAGPYKREVETVLAQLMREAQSETSAFRPDDLSDELLRARRHLARSPEEYPGLCIYSEQKIIYSEDGIPLYQPTHVIPGRIVNVWYLFWEKGKYVGICRLEPNPFRNEVI